MSKVALFLTTDFEETETITTIDILRRGNVQVATISLTGDKMVKGAHNVCVLADILFDEIKDQEGYDCLILPGGPGTSNYNKHSKLLELIKIYNDKNKKIAAICAGPTIFGGLGILDGKKAICYPGCEEGLGKATVVDVPVITDGNITTSKGPGTAIDFGIELLKILQGIKISQKVKEDFIA